MPYTKNIHFRGNEAVLTLEKEVGEPVELGEQVEPTLHTKVIGKDGKPLLESFASFPHVLIDQENASDFWDLVREEIISIGRGKQNKFLRCLLLHKIQKEL